MMCGSCSRADRRGGKHRAHRCEGEIVGPTCVTRCGCSCNAVPASFRPPVMALELLPDETV